MDAQADLSLHLNLNSLLVKRQIDNPSPGAVTGGNYPASMDKWVPYGQNQGIMPKLDPCGSHIEILAHVGPTWGPYRS